MNPCSGEVGFRSASGWQCGPTRADSRYLSPGSRERVPARRSGFCCYSSRMRDDACYYRTLKQYPIGDMLVHPLNGPGKDPGMAPEHGFFFIGFEVNFFHSIGLLQKPDAE